MGDTPPAKTSGNEAHPPVSPLPRKRERSRVATLATPEQFQNGKPAQQGPRKPPMSPASSPAAGANQAVEGLAVNRLRKMPTFRFKESCMSNNGTKAGTQFAKGAIVGGMKECGGRRRIVQGGANKGTVPVGVLEPLEPAGGSGMEVEP